MKNPIKFYPYVVFLFGILMFTNCKRSDEAIFGLPEVKPDGATLKCAHNVDKQLRHLLLFQFNENTSSTVKLEFTKALCAFKDSILEVKDLEWGINFNDLSKSQYSYCFMLTFYSMDDFLVYLNHPVHKNFINTWLNPNIKDLIAFDYWANEVKADNSRDRYKVLRHLALFNYKDSLSADAKNKVNKSFSKLSNRIRGIQKSEWGSELELLGLNKNFNDAFLLTFQHIKDYHQYLYNPLTRYFYDKDVYPNTDEVLKIDYLSNK